jgi:hypothetical protein
LDVWLCVSIIAVALMALKAANMIVFRYSHVKAVALIIIGAALPIWLSFSTDYCAVNENLWVDCSSFK